MMNNIFLLDFAGAASASAPLAGAFPFVAIYCFLSVRQRVLLGCVLIGKEFLLLSLARTIKLFPVMLVA
ncbi:hypothetical protein J8I26_02595 [Herbaspirillum sp. LeCh32-8]|uniref:hypothetical protein n=1 Tax=Herbaspirillum sp. LeCh32-8 TaxID=2821356 RepID=UPI001AE4AB54|nr:hypothetical protein [Herbaspirillum sp. LeCh32-8]MBP0596973.1 hypothetical protein [Herbaspirillum sp. LeCh32-8]